MNGCHQLKRSLPVLPPGDEPSLGSRPQAVFLSHPVLCVPLGCFHRWWSVGIFTSYFRHGTQHIGFIAQRKYTVNVCYVCYCEAV